MPGDLFRILVMYVVIFLRYCWQVSKVITCTKEFYLPVHTFRFFFFTTEQVLIISSTGVRVYEYIPGGNFILPPIDRNNVHST
jgi:hypothetical protein